MDFLMVDADILLSKVGDREWGEKMILHSIVIFCVGVLYRYIDAFSIFSGPFGTSTYNIIFLENNRSFY